VKRRAVGRQDRRALKGDGSTSHAAVRNTARRCASLFGAAPALKRIARGRKPVRRKLNFQPISFRMI